MFSEAMHGGQLLGFLTHTAKACPLSMLPVACSKLSTALTLFPSGPAPAHAGACKLPPEKAIPMHAWANVASV